MCSKEITSKVACTCLCVEVSVRVTLICKDVLLLERCPGCYVQASMELGPEDVLLLERCPHFRGCYVQWSLGPEEVSLLERCTCVCTHHSRTYNN